MAVVVCPLLLSLANVTVALGVKVPWKFTTLRVVVRSWFGSEAGFRFTETTGLTVVAAPRFLLGQLHVLVVDDPVAVDVRIEAVIGVRRGVAQQRLDRRDVGAGRRSRRRWHRPRDSTRSGTGPCYGAGP